MIAPTNNACDSRATSIRSRRGMTLNEEFHGAAAKQSTNEIFFTTFNSPATSNNSSSAGTILRADPGAGSHLKPFGKTNFSFYDAANFGPVRRRNHKIRKLNPSIFF
jgi:hypothetical protein